MAFAPLKHLIGQEVQCVVNNVRSIGMVEKSDVFRVESDAMLRQYHQLIVTYVRRIDETVAALDNERNRLMAERAHLLSHLPQQQQEKNPVEMSAQAMPKFIQKGPRPAAE